MTPDGRVGRLLARFWLQGAMIASIGLVLASAVWSAAAERAVALADFTHEQTLLAAAMGIDFENRLAAHLASPGAERIEESKLVDEVVLDLLAGARRLEQRGGLMVLVARPGQHGFLTTDKRIIASTRIRTALDRGAEEVQVPRDEAVAFGLPRRVAVAGLARVAKSDRGPWSVVVLASAERLRTRQQHEEWRLALTVLVVTVVVMLFGGFVRRRHLSDLELERRMTIASLEREREAALGKADKMATIAALSSGIAHELGTPLGVIVGRVDQVRARVADDAKATTALAIVDEQVDRIQRIVRGSLALARGESPQLEAASPILILHRAADLVAHRFRNASVELTTEVRGDVPAIACDPSLLEQALVNVLLNACQATGPGGTVRLSLEQEERDVSFVVDDEGAGIAPEIAERATEPFFSTKREEGGSGLGLTIAREIVHNHAGSLTLSRRESGRGTRARITVAVAVTT